jgi:hypothetical protein
MVTMRHARRSARYQETRADSLWYRTLADLEFSKFPEML